MEDDTVTIRTELLWDLLRCAEARLAQAEREHRKTAIAHYEQCICAARDALEANYKRHRGAS